jgi:protein-S-isoprenylcysteine O-methyltransferase Ste14
MLKRVSIFIYGVVSYVVFLATFLYALCFVGNFIVPRTIDGMPRTDLTTAIFTNLALLLVFAAQHSVMARPAFKRFLTRFVPEPAERSTYVLASSLALILLFALWQPLGGTVWEITDPTFRAVMYALFGFGWGLVLISTYLINHFDLFGLRQVWLSLRNRPFTPLKFGTPGPYKLIRHPLYFGWLFAFWATPLMSTTHLLFALATTAYILIAIRLEERDLVASLGDDYRRYRERVPMLVPFSKPRQSPKRTRFATPVPHTAVLTGTQTSMHSRPDDSCV